MIACLTLICGCLLLMAVPGSTQGAIPRTWDEVDRELTGLAEAHPNLTALHAIGSTWQGRDIWALRIFDEEYLNENVTDPLDLTPSPDPALLFLAAIHGDEKQGVNLTLTLAREMLEGYGTDDNLTVLLEARDVWIVPVANPDGYNHSNRKNTRDNGADDEFDPDLDGVDLNRNFGHEWGVDEHTSNSTNSEFYHGPGPFSEPESRVLRDLADTINFSVAISYHSGTAKPAIYYPWGWSEEAIASDDLVNFIEVGQNLSRYTQYGYGQATDSSLGGYEARGDLVDWLYANHSTLAYTIELPSAMTVEHTEGNLEALWWLMARPWGNETEGPLGNWTDQEPEPEPLPDAWVVDADGIWMGEERIEFTVSVATSLAPSWPQNWLEIALLVHNLTVAFQEVQLGTDGIGTTSFEWRPGQDRPYEYVFVVDPSDEVTENSEANNRFVLPSPSMAIETISDDASVPGPGTMMMLTLIAGALWRRRLSL